MLVNTKVNLKYPIDKKSCYGYFIDLARQIINFLKVKLVIFLIKLSLVAKIRIMVLNSLLKFITVMNFYNFFKPRLSIGYIKHFANIKFY